MLLHLLLFGLIVFLQPYLPVLAEVDGEPVVTMVEVAEEEPPPSASETKPTPEEPGNDQKIVADSAESEQGVEASGDEGAANDASTEGEQGRPHSEQDGGDSDQPSAAEEPDTGDSAPALKPETANPKAAGTGEQEPLGGGVLEGAKTPSGTEPEPAAGLLSDGARPGAAEAAPDLAPALANDVSVYGTALTETVTIPDGDDVRVVPGVAEGIPATLEEDRYDWKGYIQSMLVLLDRAITPKLPNRIDPRTDDPIVSVVVMRDGTVRSVRMVRSSGVQEIDDAVLAGLSTRMPRLPEKWPAKAARIPLLFRLPSR